MKKIDFYQLITIILSIAVVVSIGFFLYNLTQGKFGKSAVSADVAYGDAAVVINDEAKGDTPVYTEELTAGETKVDINGQQASYSTIITPAAGTLGVVHRDLGINNVFSSGQNMWFDKTNGEDAFISVISPDVPEVSVIVDGVEMGKTPIKFATKELLNQNEENKYTLTFKKDGYEEQEAIVKVRNGYTLNIRTDMFLNPFPPGISELQGLPEGVALINFSNSSNPAFTDRQSWAKAINYWLSTRGAQVIGNYNVTLFNYFIDDTGKLYNSDGNEIQIDEVKLDTGMFVAYLGSDSNAELTDAAITTISQIGGEEVVTVSGKTMLKILPTGIGYLRVRSDPSTTGTEVGRVDVGKMFELMEENVGWYKIQYEEGKEGWISGTYAEKVDGVTE